MILKENGPFFTSPREVSEILVNHYENRNNGISNDPILTSNKAKCGKEKITVENGSNPTYNRHFSLCELRYAEVDVPITKVIKR